MLNTEISRRGFLRLSGLAGMKLLTGQGGIPFPTPEPPQQPESVQRVQSQSAQQGEPNLYVQACFATRDHNECRAEDPFHDSTGTIVFSAGNLEFAAIGEPDLVWITPGDFTVYPTSTDDRNFVCQEKTWNMPDVEGFVGSVKIPCERRNWFILWLVNLFN